MITALSPLDGRYAAKAAPVADCFSEKALLQARTEVEIRYFIALSEEPGITDLKPVNATQKKALTALYTEFSDSDANRIKTIEKTTNHDVKAVEYFLKEKCKKIKGLDKQIEFIHFGLTSEDVNNLAYGLMIHRLLKDVVRPQVKSAIATLTRLSKKWDGTALLSLTHGQPATPTTVSKEINVFIDRLQRQADQLKGFSMQGKFGGAVATYSAHRAAYPQLKWEVFGTKFIKSLGLDPLANATQSNPHDDIAELSHLMIRINSILLDLSRDVWLYISRGVFKQKLVAGEIGSSTMPHKVNPIDFENAEGNIGLANALFSHFAEKLPISRLQRDLSDSTVQRNIGVAFGYTAVSFAALEKGLGKLALNKKTVRKELLDHPEVLAEGIQMVLRRRGVQGAYEKLKAVTRGEQVTLPQMLEFMETEKFSQADIDQILSVLG